MAVAIGQLPRIAAQDCRAWVSRHCDVEVVAAAYERTYLSVGLPGVTDALDNATEALDGAMAGQPDGSLQPYERIAV
jgi:hypothetical protein